MNRTASLAMIFGRSYDFEFNIAALNPWTADAERMQLDPTTPDDAPAASTSLIHIGQDQNTPTIHDQDLDSESDYHSIVGMDDDEPMQVREPPATFPVNRVHSDLRSGNEGFELVSAQVTSVGQLTLL